MKKSIKHSSKITGVSIPERVLSLPVAPTITVIGLLVMIIFMIQFPHTEIKTEEIQFVSTTSLVRDLDIELGNSRVSQKGVKGVADVTYSYSGTLFDYIFRKGNIKKEKVSSKVVKKPKDEVIIKGGKKYQYMYCSNGSYRYYNDEQFKGIDTGFTHKSSDSCAENGQGVMTGLYNAPPNGNRTNTSSANNYYNTLNEQNKDLRQKCQQIYDSSVAALGSPDDWDYSNTDLIANNKLWLDRYYSIYMSCMQSTL